VLWACMIHNLPFEFKQINVTQGDTRTAEFTQLNPARTVPVITDTDNGLTLFESAAILVYLSNKFKWDSYYPTCPKLRAKTDQYLHWHHSNTRQATLMLFRPLLLASFGAAPIPTAEQKAKSVKSVSSWMKIIEGWLSQNDYLITTSPTIADLLCYAELGQLPFINAFDFDGYPKTQAWMKRMQGLPKFKEAHAEMVKFTKMILSKTSDPAAAGGGGGSGGKAATKHVDTPAHPASLTAVGSIALGGKYKAEIVSPASIQAQIAKL